MSRPALLPFPSKEGSAASLQPTAAKRTEEPEASTSATRHARTKKCTCLHFRLEPPTALEYQVQREGDHKHQRQRERVAERPVQLGHAVEVHPVDRADERRGEQDRRPGADLLHLLVLLDANQGEVHAKDVLQKLPEALHPLGHLYGV